MYLFLYVYGCFAWMHVCAHACSARDGQRRASHLLEPKLQIALSCHEGRCWKSNLGPRKEQTVLLHTEPPLHPSANTFLAPTCFSFLSGNPQNSTGHWFLISNWFFFSKLLCGFHSIASSSCSGWTATLNQDEEGEIGIKTEFMHSDPYFHYLLCLGLKCPSKGHVLKVWSPDHGTVGKL